MIHIFAAFVSKKTMCGVMTMFIFYELHAAILCELMLSLIIAKNMLTRSFISWLFMIIF